MPSEKKFFRFLSLMAVVLVVLAGSAGLAFAERRVALVIGNSGYQNAARLINPGKDASAIGDLFKNAGFDVVNIGLDLGSLDFKRRVREFQIIARDADIAVVFFAGHGIEVDGVNYLIPVDARLASDFDADDEGVSLDRIIRSIELAKRLRLVIVDACRDNPFAKKMQRTVSIRAVTNGLAKIEPALGDTLVAYAAKAGSTAEDGYGDHSPFTTALLKHLAVPGLDIRIAFGRVRDEVLKNTRGKQEPFVYGSLGGTNISLVPEPPKPEPPAPVASDSGNEIRARYEFAERIGTKAAWEYFLAAHSTGLYADLARAQIAKLAASPSAASANAGPVARKQDPGQAETKVAPPRQDDQARAGADARLKAEREAEEKRKAYAAVEPQASPRSCKQDEERLARLRTTRSGEDIIRFERDLFCEQLRPQLLRLKESVVGAISPPAAPPAAPIPPPMAAVPPVVAPSPPKEVDARPQPDGEVQRSGSPAASAQGPDAACQQDEERLVRLRTSRVAEDILAFDRELVCERLRPQLLRLRESVVGR